MNIMWRNKPMGFIGPRIGGGGGGGGGSESAFFFHNNVICDLVRRNYELVDENQELKRKIELLTLHREITAGIINN